jgi:Cys-rich protein (TIGR01571 family)
LTEIFVFWCFFLAIIFLFFFPTIPGFILILCGVFYLTYRRASYRTLIRQKLSIAGTFADDLAKHLCCPCCSICQEAREANETSLLILDYCSGEQIVMQEIAHDIATGRINSSLQSPSPSLEEGGTFWNHLTNISLTSKIILLLCSLVISISFIVLFLLEKEQNLVILLLTFLQPILLLYFVYWRGRRQYATLDMVIKLFAIGFWLTTFQSIVFEEILQTILMLLLGPFIATSLSAQDDSLGEYDGNGEGEGEGVAVPSSSSSVALNLSFFASSKMKKVFQIFQLLSASSSSDGFAGGEYQYEAMGQEALSSSATDPETEAGDDTDEVMRQKMKHHLWLVILVVFAMAFVIAAGVEETMKHFSVRCCRFPAPLNDPHTILVYLMASGLASVASSSHSLFLFPSSQRWGSQPQRILSMCSVQQAHRSLGPLSLLVSY